MFLLQGSVPNKFYVHNDIFRYEDEVFGDSEGELDEGEKDSCVGFVSFLFLSLCRAARCVCGDVGMQTVLPAVGHRGVTEALWSKMF